jgi:hypothetical protein
MYSYLENTHLVAFTLRYKTATHGSRLVGQSEVIPTPVRLGANRAECRRPTGDEGNRNSTANVYNW